MADDKIVSQEEIERLFNQPKAAAGPPAAEKPTAAAPLPGGVSPPIAGASAASSTAQSTPPPKSEQSPQSNEPMLAQADLDRLLGQAGPAATAVPSTATSQAAPSHAAGTAVDEPSMAPGDLEFLLNQAERALQSIQSPQDEFPPSGTTPFRLEEFTGAAPNNEGATLDLIRDVELDLKIELGRTHMYLDDVLKLRKGAVVPLDKLAGDPVDIYVNGRLIARGEVLVLNDNFCVRIAELIAGVKIGA